MKKMLLSLILGVAFGFTNSAWSAISERDRAELGIEQNVTPNGGCESGTAGWARYDDGSAAAPVDGTGGSPNAAFTITASTSTPIDGNASCLLTKDAADRRGHGWSYAFTVKKLAMPYTVTVDYKIASGTYDTGSDTTDPDITAWVYGPTDGTPVLTQLAPYKVLGATVGLDQRFQGRFQTAASGTAYRLILHESKTGTSAYTVKVEARVSVEQKTYGAVQTDPVAYTPTFTGFGTAASVNFTSWRDGAFLYVDGTFTTGTCTATEARISLGYNGVNGGVTTVSTLATISVAGQVSAGGGNSATFFGNNATTEASTSYMTFGALSSTQSGLTKGNGSAIFANATVYSVKARFQIAGWSSNVLVSSDADTRVTLATVSGAVASTTAANVIVFPTVLKDTHGGYSSGRYTAPVPGDYRVSAYINGTNAVGYVVYKNGSTTGQYLATAPASGQASGSVVIPNVKAGDILDIRPDATTGSISGSSTNASFDRISGPAQIAASENVSLTYGLNSAVTPSANAVVKFDTKLHDSHGAYSTSTGLFTAPRADKYRISANYQTGSSTSGVVYKNGSALITFGTTGSSTLSGGSITLQLNQGDTLGVYTNTSVQWNGISGSQYTCSLSIESAGN